MLKINRRQAIAASVGACVGAWVGAPALAQSFPTKPVKLVLPYAAGGPSDFTIRLLAKELTPALGQSVIVENIAGGQGAIGSRRVSKSEPDGHTLLLATSATHAANVFLMKDLGYDPIKDFTPVSGIGDLQHIVVIRNNLPVNNIADFIRYAKANPGKMNYGSSGIGSGGHLGIEAFKRRTGVDLQHVPFVSAAQLNNELLADRIDIAITSMPVAVVHVRAKTIRALAMASENRSPQLPELPTLKELGIQGCESDTWMGLWAPPGTPAAIVERINREVVTILKRPDIAESLTRNAITLNVRETKVFAEYVASEIKRYGELVRQIGIQPS